MNNKNINNLGYIPALDGLRAFAVVLVLMVHANFKLGLNGGLGVSIFFALSGFLITTLLLEEYNKNGDISFKGFYIRRTMRLFPPLYTMLLFVFLYAFLFRTGEIQLDIFHDIITSGLYVYNIAWAWGWSMHEVMLYHTWSLGVEEQFYLIWPFILYWCIKRKAFKSLQIILLIFIAATWILKSKNLYPFVAGSIIKESIFIGCAGALLRWNGFQIKISTHVAFLLLTVMLLLGIAPFKIPYYDSTFNICSIMTVFIIWHIVQNQQSKIAEFLSNKTIVFIGKISYSLYLWHLPVFRIFAFHSTLPPLVSFAAKFIVSFLLAILSWFTVEKVTTAWGRSMSKKIIASKNKAS